MKLCLKYTLTKENLLDSQSTQVTNKEKVTTSRAKVKATKFGLKTKAEAKDLHHRLVLKCGLTCSVLVTLSC